MENHPNSVKDRHTHSAGKISIEKAEIYLILRTKTASRPLLYEETSRMHCSGVNSAHSSTQTVSRPLLWDLTGSSFHRFSVGFRSRNFLSWKPIQSFLACVFGIIVLPNHPDFNFIILEDGIRFWSRPSLYMSVPFLKKTAPYHVVPTSRLHCSYDVFGVICSTFCSPNMVCIMPSKEFKFGPSDQTMLNRPLWLSPLLLFSLKQWYLLISGELWRATFL